MKKIIIFLIFILLQQVCINNIKKPKILLISIPKCGTWLTIKLISLLTQRDYRLKKCACKPKSPENTSWLFCPTLEGLNECLAQVQNNQFLLSHMIYDKEYDEALQKLNYKIIFTIRDPRGADAFEGQEFDEDLVGPQGGGDYATQINTIKRIAQHLDLKTNSTHINAIKGNIFGNTHTFREGQIGEWKKYFAPEHKKWFKKIAGQLLIELGYEKDLNW